MLNRFRAAALAALVLPLLASVPARAQSDILLRLRSGSPVGDRFRVDSAGGVVAVARLGYGIIPATGSGDRLMFHPFKAAFRVGGTDGTAFDDANVGFYTFAAGYNNVVSATYGFAGGNANTVQSSAGTALGTGNTLDNTATGGFAAGGSNTCLASFCVALGYTNNADGQGAVAIGYRSTADADYSLAMGYRASTNGRTGAMVFADASTTDSLEASANNQFSVRAAGGYRLYTNATETAGLTMNAGGSSWSAVSDRNRKENFRALDGEDVLLRLRGVPVTSWQYKAEEDRTVRHVGPMAQDWHAAFGLSGDDKTINMSDFDGVNLAAVQALEARTAALQAQVAERDQRIESLEARIARLEALVAAQAAAQP